ncbi:MAG: type III pantothenate kinase [Clostridia bacterium]|nr:type III pantothenate kinase [Clostridia bacterium]
MILAIDIGNTNVVLGCIEDDNILFEARMATDQLKTSDEYCAELFNILSLNRVEIERISGSIISSVVPPVLNSFCTAVKRLIGCEPLIVGPGIKTGLNVRTDDPAEVGGDLITAAVAAVKEYGAPLLIVDMGTATTISAIDAKGAYLGGCICPGLRISQEALTNRTSQLPGIRLETPKKAIGRNTVDCMRSGIMLGAAAMLDGLLDRMEDELGTEAKIIVTGGMARQIFPLCRREMIYDGNLLLKGLNILYKNNVK